MCFDDDVDPRADVLYRYADALAAAGDDVFGVAGVTHFRDDGGARARAARSVGMVPFPVSTSTARRTRR